MIHFDKPFEYIELFYARVYVLENFCNFFKIKVVK